MKNVFLYSWNEHSEGAKELSEALGIRRIRHAGSRFRSFEDKIMINWGASRVPFAHNYINHPDAVAVAGNKLYFFNQMQIRDRSDPCRTVPWTTDRVLAATWKTVVCRNLLRSSSGRGIIIVQPEGNVDNLPECPLYTKYIQKDKEFRVHIVDNEVIDVQRKIRDPNSEPRDWKIRSHQNGFIFIRGGIEIPEDVSRQALFAFCSSGLDFAAIDVIIKKDGTAYVLEANSAPGLEGSTVGKYADALKKLVRKRQDENSNNESLGA